MSSMSIETVLSIAGAGASGVAAVISIWQARIARSQANSALRQAVSSETQSDLMRQQLIASRAAAVEDNERRHTELVMAYANSVSHSRQS
jgi:hypothetical protein